MVLSCLVIVPEIGRAPSIDPYEVPPGNPIWFPLDGFDSEGEVLHYTITFKKSQKEGDVQRPIDFILIETSIADQNPDMEIALQFSLHSKQNISERTVGEFKNDRDSQVMALFFNDLRDDDKKDWDNASVLIRFDYYITGEESEARSPFLTVLIVVFAVIVLLVMVVLIVRRFKRGKKDAVTFFNPETGPYYVVRALVDSRVFYLDQNQYSQLYSSGRLNEFEFLGTSPRVGGTIIPPEGQEAVVLEPQALPAIPLQEAFTSDDVLLANMTAQPVTVPENWNEAVQEVAGPAPMGSGEANAVMQEGVIYGTEGPAMDTVVQETKGEGEDGIDGTAPLVMTLVEGTTTGPLSDPTS